MTMTKRCKECGKDRKLNDRGLCDPCQMKADQAAQARGHRATQPPATPAKAALAAEGYRRSGSGPQPVNRQGMKSGRPS